MPTTSSCADALRGRSMPSLNVGPQCPSWAAERSFSKSSWLDPASIVDKLVRQRRSGWAIPQSMGQMFDYARPGVVYSIRRSV